MQFVAINTRNFVCFVTFLINVDEFLVSLVMHMLQQKIEAVCWSRWGFCYLIVKKENVI